MMVRGSDGLAIVAFQAFGIKLDLESGGRLRPCVTARNRAREYGGGFRCVWVGQILRRNVMHVAGRFALEVGKHARSAGLGVWIDGMARWWREALRAGGVFHARDYEQQQNKAQYHRDALIEAFHDLSSPLERFWKLKLDAKSYSALPDGGPADPWAFGEAVTRTVSPSTSESGGLVITESVAETPETTSTSLPKSRPSVIFVSAARLPSCTVPTCKPSE